MSYKVFMQKPFLNQFLQTLCRRPSGTGNCLTRLSRCVHIETPSEVGTTSVSTVRFNPLATFIVVALLGMIVVVLILPDVDLPDTAFQRNSSMQGLLVLSHQMPHSSATAGSSLHLPMQLEDVSIRVQRVQDTRAWSTIDLPIQHKALRC